MYSTYHLITLEVTGAKSSAIKFHYHTMDIKQLRIGLRPFLNFAKEKSSSQSTLLHLRVTCSLAKGTPKMPRNFHN